MSSLYDEDDYCYDNEEVQQQPTRRKKSLKPWVWGLLLKFLFVAALAAALYWTYDQCIWCVLGIMCLSALTMNCIPFMPIVFMLSLATLIMRAVNYDNATIKVEVPLQNVIHVPTWDDMQQYVSVVKPTTTTASAAKAG